VVARAENVIIFPDNVDYLDICGAFVNPLTAIGLIDTAIYYNANYIINNACESAVGRMICKVAHDRGLSVIGVVKDKKKWKDLEPEL